ncbi:hypothetical protein QYE76_043034 [Lolium multiflorum]|uniref:Transposase (putative) gypsy type domain-containing protein n=1 Tax=Lolium multiflorum TaxID=4521 RepID=A0AAD8WXK1_LOLMU|nr:hypothetical protein QYE76_043034 [Lolium multiflorum]
MAMEDLKLSEWERSKISNQDVNLLKKLGLMKKEKMLIFPGEESFPTPGIRYWLHHLTPNSILHISIFITLCEFFLGTPPNWGMWKRIFLVRRNSSHNTAYNVGGVVICVRPDVEYFDVKFPDSVQGWRKRWLYIREEDVDSQEYNVAPFHGSEKILRRRSWDGEATDEEKTAREALMKRIHELQNTDGNEWSEKMGQDFELEEPEGNRLRDTLSLLEIHGDLARRTIVDAKTAFTRLFPYFPKKDQPSTFAALTKCFIPEEDLGLALRQENLKVGVEGTIALVAESQQNVDWAKAGETKRMKTEKWQAFIRAAKPHSKKILSFLGYKPAPSSSSAKPEVK